MKHPLSTNSRVSTKSNCGRNVNNSTELGGRITHLVVGNDFTFPFGSRKAHFSAGLRAMAAIAWMRVSRLKGEPVASKGPKGARRCRGAVGYDEKSKRMAESARTLTPRAGSWRNAAGKRWQQRGRCRASVRQTAANWNLVAAIKRPTNATLQVTTI